MTEEHASFSSSRFSLDDSFEHFDELDTADANLMGGFDALSTAADPVDRIALIRSWLRDLNQSGDSVVNYAFFPKPSTNYVKVTSVVICNVLGALCVLLNLFVIFALIRNRRRVLRNVFYVLVLHCAVVDLIRGACLIAWGMPHLVINNMSTMDDRLFALKINQFTLLILRSCNLLTIFNLLVFTTNEFIVIKYPLHYRRCFRRRTVLMILAMSWLISLFFGIGSVFANLFESAHSLFVPSDNSVWSKNATDSDVTRREMAGVSINVVSMLMIFGLCYVCLFTVLICYGTILRTIRRFHNCDDKGRFHSEESQRFNRSVYCKHNDSTKTNASSAEMLGEDPNNPNKRCNSHKKWRSHLMSRHKYLIVIGSVLFVDVLFLFPYSGIQLVAFLHLNNLLTTTPKSAMIRWGLQILIGIHSVCQPLCYFRMNEFRRLACCAKNRNLHRSKSFSQTKDQLGTNDDEIALRDNQSRELACEPLINGQEPMDSDDERVSSVPVHLPPSKIDSQFLGTNWTRIGSTKFRRYGPPEEENKHKLSSLSGLRSSTYCEQESSFMPQEFEDGGDSRRFRTN